MAGESAFGSTAIGQLSRSAYPLAEWELLVGLPTRVMIAAASAVPDPRRTVAQGLAGMEAIAAGRASDSELVRAVAAAVYARSEDDQPEVEELTGRAAESAEVLAACRAAIRGLVGRADPADSAAYRQWLQRIAVRVCGAGRAGRPPGVGGEGLSPAAHRFLGDLGVALGL